MMFLLIVTHSIIILLIVTHTTVPEEHGGGWGGSWTRFEQLLQSHSSIDDGEGYPLHESVRVFWLHTEEEGSSGGTIIFAPIPHCS